ncbi:MAG: Ni/Fe hydrogenase subunit alpha [Chloroflexi bacterium]|nr:Ni/Fe hydrogenase subunit alpha [Chloroflexota bacterium]
MKKETVHDPKRISIDPITRLEGHGKIEIFLDDNGEVKNAYLQIPELRGFEKFCEGRLVEDVPQITERICGVCPEAHHMAGIKAVDAVYHVDPPPTAKKLRELLYSTFYVTDHSTHFYALSGPDFVMGPDCPPAQRNIIGVIGKVPDVALQVVKTRTVCHEIIEMIGGRKIHPCGGLPGGMSHGLTEEQRQHIEKTAKEMVEFAKLTIKVFNDIVLANKAYVDLILSDMYSHKTYNMGMVDEKNKVNFYDGKVRVTGPDGKELVKYSPNEYLDNIAGWKGLVDGVDSGVYKATPLSRLNAADGMATPLAQEEYERMYKTLGGKPVHATLATHWARVIELMYAAERMLQLASDKEITGPDFRILPTATPDEGVGIVEAPRGTLTHHYKTDKNGVVEKVNLIVGTTNNYAAMCMSVKKAAEGLFKGGKKANEGLLNKIEMAFRAYDPCMSCATHTLPGQMPLEVRVLDKDGNLLQTLKRNID